jgi:hypothetical protein
MTDPKPAKRLYTRRESAVYAAMSTREIDREISAGHIVAKKRGRRTYIEVAELDRYIDRLPALEPKRFAS